MFNMPRARKTKQPPESMESNNRSASNEMSQTTNQDPSPSGSNPIKQGNSKKSTQSTDTPDPNKVSKELPKGKGRNGKANNIETNSLSDENILVIVEAKMSEMFASQFEELKDKLITLMAQQLSKLTTKVDNMEQEFLKCKEDHQPNNTITIVEDTPELEAIRNSQEKNKKKTDALSKNITNISNQLNEFRAELDATHQQLKEYNIRLVGLPEIQPFGDDDMTSNIVKFSQEHLSLSNIGPDDIEEVTRLGRKREDKPRDVLITFRSKQIRNKFYKQRKNLYDVNSKRSSSGIYINEDLTPYRQRLYFDTRNLRKNAAIHSVWTAGGTIMVKLEENSIPKPILTHRDLADLLRHNTDYISEAVEDR